MSALDPRLVEPTALEDTLRSLGYTVRDLRKARSFEEQEEELRLERRRLVLAGLFTAASIASMLVTWLELVSQRLLQPSCWRVCRHGPWPQSLVLVCTSSN